MDKAAETSLLVRSLVTGYGKKQVLNHVTVHVGSRELVAIIGHNGSGKSTLLRSIYGLLPSWEGEICFGERNLYGTSARERLKAGLAYLPQGNRVFSGLTVQENLRAACACLGRDANVPDTIDQAIAPFPQLQKRMGQKAGSLSGGERQMLAIARSLLLSPRMILLDEPSLGLAAPILRSVFDNIKSLSQRNGIACLIVEQNVREVLRIADRVYVLKNGEVTYKGPPDPLQDLAKLREAYF